jgi:hypothetical protein
MIYKIRLDKRRAVLTYYSAQINLKPFNFGKISDWYGSYVYVIVSAY